MARHLGTPVEHMHVRRHNLSVVLRLLATQGPRSRAALAGVTGLTRATVSSLVAELIHRGLVRELGVGVEQRVGRPATLVELDGSRVVTIGIAIDVGYMQLLANDLAGNAVYEHRRRSSGDSVDVDAMVAAIAEEMEKAVVVAESQGRRVVGATIAIPGVVDLARGVVRVAPNLGWRDVAVVQLLAERLDLAIPVAIDNEANLGALAEFRAGKLAGTNHLIFVLALNGVGGGVIVDGSLMRGASGAGGEVGHMTVQLRGRLCACGSRGCWETTIGLHALLTGTVPDVARALLADKQASPESKVAIVIERARSNDQVAIAGLERFGYWVGLGLANLVDAFNPQAIVLAGYLPDLAPWMMHALVDTFWRNALVDAAQACRIELSSLGIGAPALGGAIHAAERLFDDPTLVGDHP